MNPPSLLSPELSAQTPAEVLNLLERLQNENEHLRAEMARLETRVAQVPPSAASPEGASPSSYARTKKRKARKHRRKFRRALRIVLLLALTLIGGALVAWLLASAIVVGSAALN